MVKAKKMSVEQYLEIGQWLILNKSRIQEKKFTQGDVQTLISDDVGYDVPLSSLIRCAKAMGVRWARSPVAMPPVPLDHEAIVILIGALEGLYVEMGKTIPDDLANLHSTYVSQHVYKEPKEPEIDRVL